MTHTQAHLGRNLPAGKALPRVYKALATACGMGYQEKILAHIPRKSGESRPKGGEKLQGFLGDIGGKHMIYNQKIMHRIRLLARLMPGFSCSLS